VSSAHALDFAVGLGDPCLGEPRDVGGRQWCVGLEADGSLRRVRSPVVLATSLVRELSLP